MLFKKSIKNNPAAARIYSTVRLQPEKFEDSKIVKLNGKRPESFVYSRTHGIYVLPGQHLLKIEYSVFTPDSGRYNLQGATEMNVSVEPGCRYALICEENGKNYSLVDLPSAQSVGEEELITYFDEKARNQVMLTADMIRQELNKSQEQL